MIWLIWLMKKTKGKNKMTKYKVVYGVTYEWKTKFGITYWWWVK